MGSNASSKYDVIIIGGGIGGLIAGCCLSKAGLKILLLEKNDRVGGCCVSFERKGYRFDAGAHIFGSCKKGQVLGDILNDLDLNIDFLQFDPMDRINFPDRQITIPNNVEIFKSHLKEEFKSEAHNVDKFFNLISYAKNDFSSVGLFKKYGDVTYEELLNSCFNNYLLKSILSFGCGYLGLPPSKLSSLSALFMLRSYLFDGAYYPKGGAQVFSDAIKNKILDNGGSVLLRNRVKKLICEKKMINKVVVENNNVFEGNYIIANVDPYQTYYGFLDIKDIKPDSRLLNKLRNFKKSLSFIFLYLIISRDYDCRGKNGWYFPSHNIEKDFYNQMYIHVPTILESDAGFASKNVLEIGTVFHAEYEHVDNWEKAKRDGIDRTLALLEKRLPGISQYIDFCDAASPQTFYKYTYNSKGAAYGWEQSPHQIYAKSFPSTTKAIRNLFLAGHWTFPGGGIVSVAISGLNAAKKVMKRMTHD